MATQGLEGCIQIRLAVQGGRVCSASVQSMRPVQASRVLEGRSIEQGLELLPLLFSVCGKAQSCAALAAVERALGIEPLPVQRTVREMLLLAETAYEHLSRILLDWPGYLGEPPATAALARVRGAHHGIWASPSTGRQLLRQASVQQVERLAGSPAVLEPVLVDTVFAMHPEDWLRIATYDALQAWAPRSSTIAGRMLSKLTVTHIADLGRSSTEPMPDIPLDEWDRMLAADHTGARVVRPSWQGRVYETGALARQHAHPLVQDLLSRCGNGLLTRLVARLVELAAIPARLRQLQAAIAGQGSSAGARLPAYRDADGAGAGVVEAARGRLVHRVELGGGQFLRYRILAPTEWNFHPEGPLAKGLLGMDAGDEQSLRGRAGLLVTALDPCVAYDIAIAGRA